LLHEDVVMHGLCIHQISSNILAAILLENHVLLAFVSLDVAVSPLRCARSIRLDRE
jgi:hypothetical protein